MVLRDENMGWEVGKVGKGGQKVKTSSYKKICLGNIMYREYQLYGEKKILLKYGEPVSQPAWAHFGSRRESPLLPWMFLPMLS